jgi:hypothetical protein
MVPALGWVAIAHAAPEEVCVPAQQAARALNSDEFAQLSGRYRMDDGSVVKVAGSRLRPVALIDGADPIPLISVASGHLVSEDGRLTLRFRADRKGDYEGVTLSRAGGAPQLAQADR